MELEPTAPGRFRSGPIVERRFGRCGFVRIIDRLCYLHPPVGAIENGDIVEPARNPARTTTPNRWNDEEDGAGSRRDGEKAQAFKPLTKEEASALRAKEPPLSPWRVVAVQVMVGVVAALLAGLLTQRQEVAWSVLYGAATVVVPGVLMARGMTSRISSMSPGSSAVSFMLWEMVKIAVSVVMLMLAPKLVQPLVWPALLVGLVLGMKVYWLALLWRGRAK